MPLLIATVRRRKHAIVAALAIAIPLAVVWLVSGSATNVHSLSELLPGNPRAYFHGLFGLILDGAAGITFQAPFYLLALFAITFWRIQSASVRLLALSVGQFLCVPYMLIYDLTAACPALAAL